MQWFRVDLKAFLGLAMPNHYSQTVRKQIPSWFWGDNFGPKSPNLYMIPIYSTAVLYDTVLHDMLLLTGWIHIHPFGFRIWSCSSG